MSNIKKLQAHVFICTNERDANHPRGCCKLKGSEAVVDEFKRYLREKNLHQKIRAQKAGCLDTCEYGSSVVVYPDGTWYGGVRVSDVAEIVDQHLVQGQVVERLLMPGK